MKNTVTTSSKGRFERLFVDDLKTCIEFDRLKGLSNFATRTKFFKFLVFDYSEIKTENKKLVSKLAALELQIKILKTSEK